MITLCSVICKENSRYIPYFLENVIAKTKLINEICLCNTDLDENYHREYAILPVKIKEMGLKRANISGMCWRALGHSFGMVEAIKYASNNYIYMSDPDLLFYTAVDELYYNWMQQYNLQIIGAAHHIGINYSCKYFPNPVNLMIKKSDLPPSGTFKGIIKANETALNNGLTNKYDSFFEENYLCPCRPSKIINEYPNPEGITDTGILLYWWIKGKWLSFLTQDVHNYTSQIYKSNFQLKEKFPKTKLFYHATSGADSRHMFWDDFLKVSQ